LQQGKVQLTWDETRPERKAALKRAFEVASDDEEADELAKNLLASDGEDEVST